MSNENYDQMNGNYSNGISEGYGNIPVEPGNRDNNNKKTKKGGNKMARAAAAIALAAVFGLSAGAGVYGVKEYSSVAEKGIMNWLDEKASAADEAGADTAEAGADQPERSSKLGELSDEAKDSGALKLGHGGVSIISSDVTSVVKSAMPSIVSIDCNFKTRTMNFFGQTMEQEQAGSGSGIIVGKSDSELIIVTNNHVVEGASSMSATFSDGNSATAYLKGTDPSVDIAVIAVEIEDITDDTLDAIKIASIGNSDELQVGEPAIAIGNALGYGQSVTTGVVSALGREIETEDGEKNSFIQTDAAINPGNSGGALLNASGEVIGVTSSKIGSTTVEGMGFAIPISDVEELIDRLMNLDTKIAVKDEDRGALGISVMTPSGIDGAYVAAVNEGGAADKAGIKEGDLITAFDGNSITSAADLTSMMSYYEKGSTVTVTVLRKDNGQYGSLDIEVTLGEMPQEEEDN
ncbi:S1C family serine protease [Butyrivibrio sp. MC2013]|uniref:S1C family serine protease n=1 Tax=Butyrivibrio sp. MC2013 TaxID=1280686 RepID=UPI00041700D3|nr:trypsin-like peptidase domain-containing protein [Butyrivibrio sp. MC2013]